MMVKNVELDIVEGCVAEIQADAVVNPCDVHCGLSRYLTGIQVRTDCLKNEEGGDSIAFVPGRVAWTIEASPPGRIVIHALFADESGQTNEYILRQTCQQLLRFVRARGIETVVFPSLLPASAVFPPVGMVKILAQEILKFVRTDPGRLQRIVVCLEDSENYKIYRKEMIGYLHHIQTDLGEGPYVTVDIIIERPEGIVVIERSHPPLGIALPGGFVDPGESLETAARREAWEETGLKLDHLHQFHTYSAPDRDPRFHTVSTVFIAQGRGIPRFGDDAQGLKILSREDLLSHEFAFDHKMIIRDYLNGVYL